MSNTVYILTGDIQIGKTTSLMQWIEGREVYGILTPIIDGKRKFLDIESKEYFNMEADENEKEVLQIGRYTFSATAFERANNILSSAAKKEKGYIIIDEIGPLELKESGLHDSINVLFQQSNIPIVIVVRTGLVDKVITHFNLNNYQIIDKGNLSMLTSK
jgi:nucleoside-triphosphatase THEP1